MIYEMIESYAWHLLSLVLALWLGSDVIKSKFLRSKFKRQARNLRYARDYGLNPNLYICEICISFAYGVFAFLVGICFLLISVLHSGGNSGIPSNRFYAGVIVVFGFITICYGGYRLKDAVYRLLCITLFEAEKQAVNQSVGGDGEKQNAQAKNPVVRS